MKKISFVSILLISIMVLTIFTSCGVKIPGTGNKQNNNKEYENFVSEETYTNSDVGFTIPIPKTIESTSFQKIGEKNKNYVAHTMTGTSVFAIITSSEDEIKDVKTVEDVFSSMETEIARTLVKCNTNRLIPMKYKSSKLNAETVSNIKNVPSEKFNGTMIFSRGENIDVSINVIGYSLIINSKPVVVFFADYDKNEASIQKVAYEIECTLKALTVDGDKNA